MPLVPRLAPAGTVAVARRPDRFAGDVANGRGGEVRAYWLGLWRDIRDSYEAMYPDAEYLSQLWSGPVATYESGEPVDLDGSDVEVAYNTMLPGVSRRKRYRLMPDDTIVELADDEGPD